MKSRVKKDRIFFISNHFLSFNPVFLSEICHFSGLPRPNACLTIPKCICFCARLTGLQFTSFAEKNHRTLQRCGARNKGFEAYIHTHIYVILQSHLIMLSILDFFFSFQEFQTRVSLGQFFDTLCKINF